MGTNYLILLTVAVGLYSALAMPISNDVDAAFETRIEENSARSLQPQIRSFFDSQAPPAQHPLPQGVLRFLTPTHIPSPVLDHSEHPEHPIDITFIPGVAFKSADADILRNTEIGRNRAAGYLNWHYPGSKEWRLVYSLGNGCNLKDAGAPKHPGLVGMIEVIRLVVKDKQKGSFCHPSCIMMVDNDKRVYASRHELVHGTLLRLDSNEGNWGTLETKHEATRPPTPQLGSNVYSTRTYL